MPQMHLYVPKNLAEELKARARAHGLTVSKYLATLVQRDIGPDWPEDFFSTVVGGWRGGRLARPRQGAVEKRRAL
jgi:hypothetical protein